MYENEGGKIGNKLMETTIVYTESSPQNHNTSIDPLLEDCIMTAMIWWEMI